VPRRRRRPSTINASREPRSGARYLSPERSRGKILVTCGPCFFLVHGGGFTGGSRDLLAPHARYFRGRAAGCASTSAIGPRTRPEVTIQNSAEDVHAAFDWGPGTRRRNAAGMRSILSRSVNPLAASSRAALPGIFAARSATLGARTRSCS